MADLAAVREEFDASLEQWAAETLAALDKRFGLAKYSDDEPRDERGRWTAGSGTGTGERDTSVIDAVRQARVDEIKTQAELTAKSLGFDTSKIDIQASRPPFELNGKMLDYAGSANLETGRINLYTDHLTVEHAAGVTAHEVMHQKFQTVFNAYQAERDKVNADPRTYEAMRPNGSLKEPLDKEYPIYQALQEHLSAYDLGKDDGVSDYSRDWWNAFENKTATGMQAVHETLAEMSRLKFQGQRIQFMARKPDGFLTVRESSPIWEKLYADVNHFYPKVKT